MPAVEAIFGGAPGLRESQISTLVVYIGGCFSASFDRLTLGSQCHPLQHQWRALLSYKVHCASEIWRCSRAAGGQNHEFGGIGGFCSASSHRLTMESQRHPLVCWWKAFRHRKSPMGTIFGGALGLREAETTILVVLGDFSQRVLIV